MHDVLLETALHYVDPHHMDSQLLAGVEGPLEKDRQWLPAPTTS